MQDLEASEGIAFAYTLSGVVMTVSVTTAKHSLEHAHQLIIRNYRMVPD